MAYPAPGHTDPNLTDKQRANNVKLSAYLLALPVEYRGFDMGLFASDNNDGAHVVTCGAVACAVGHGPAAGVVALGFEYWPDYAYRVFGQGAWQWCFSGDWADTDNTPHGAARRINLMLEKGIPNNASEQMWGEAPLSYAVAP